jgi:hypothetical protein
MLSCYEVCFFNFLFDGGNNRTVGDSHMKGDIRSSEMLRSVD